MLRLWHNYTDDKDIDFSRSPLAFESCNKFSHVDIAFKEQLYEVMYRISEQS